MLREEAKEIISRHHWSFASMDYEVIEAIECLSEECEDAISRAAAIKAMDDLEQEDIERYSCSIPEGFDGKRAIEALQSLPSVTPKQKMGRWEWVQYDDFPSLGDWVCSECKSVAVECVRKDYMGGIPIYKYCPNCGAKMVEPQERSGKE